MIDFKIIFKISQGDFEKRDLILEALKRELIKLKMDDIIISDNRSVAFKNSYFRKSGSWHVMSPINKGKLEFVHQNNRFLIVYTFPIPSFTYVFIGISLIVLCVFNNLAACGFFLIFACMANLLVYYNQKAYFKNIFNS